MILQLYPHHEDFDVEYALDSIIDRYRSPSTAGIRALSRDEICHEVDSSPLAHWLNGRANRRRRNATVEVCVLVLVWAWLGIARRWPGRG
jgi:hypothetical protein